MMFVKHQNYHRGYFFLAYWSEEEEVGRASSQKEYTSRQKKISLLLMIRQFSHWLEFNGLDWERRAMALYELLRNTCTYIF